jgi:hypothetical protein
VDTPGGGQADHMTAERRSAALQVAATAKCADAVAADVERIRPDSDGVRWLRDRNMHCQAPVSMPGDVEAEVAAAGIEGDADVGFYHYLTVCLCP